MASAIHLQNQLVCPICCDVITSDHLALIQHENEGDAIQSGVAHCFHLECIHKWKGGTECPIDRRVVHSINDCTDFNAANNRGNTISSKERGAAVRAAAALANDLVVKTLLTRPIPTPEQVSHQASAPTRQAIISDEDRGDALCFAAASGSLNNVHLLLEGGKISDKNFNLALLLAANNGFVDIVFEIWEKMCLLNKKISDLTRNHAIGNASNYGYLEIVEILLRTGPISDTVRGMAVITAAKNGYLGIVELLLDNGSISQDHRQVAVVTAAENGYLGTVERLLENDPSADLHRVQACIAAVEQDHLELFLAVAENGSDHAWDDAIACAALHHRFEWLQKLWKGKKRGTVDNLSLSSAHNSIIFWAAHCGRLDIVQEFLHFKNISDPDRADAVVTAAESGYLEIIKTLLDGGKISDSGRQEAIAKAQGPKQREIIAFLKSLPL